MPMLTYNGCITCSKTDMGLIVVFGGNDELHDYELAKFTVLSLIDYRPQSGRVGVASDASKVGLAPVYFRRLLGVLLNLVKLCCEYRSRATTLETIDDCICGVWSGK